MDFAAIAELCAPGVAPGTLERIASVESHFNPYAIGVVGGRLERQPRSRDEAIATADMLAGKGWNYSVGVVQVNQSNFGKYGLTPETAFDPCSNLRAGALILEDCYRRAGKSDRPLSDALSCYYSGNFSAGYRLGYVAKVEAAPSQTGAAYHVSPIPVIATVRMRTHRVAVQAQRAGAGERSALFVSTPMEAMPAGTASIDTPSPPKGPSTALLF